MQDEQDNTFSSFNRNAESDTSKISSGELTDGKGEAMFPLLHVHRITVSYDPTLLYADQITLIWFPLQCNNNEVRIYLISHSFMSYFFRTWDLWGGRPSHWGDTCFSTKRDCLGWGSYSRHWFLQSWYFSWSLILLIGWILLKILLLFLFSLPPQPSLLLFLAVRHLFYLFRWLLMWHMCWILAEHSRLYLLSV